MPQQSKNTIAESRYFLDKILNASPGLIYIYDLHERRNVYVNRGPLEFLVHPEDRAAVAEHHARFGTAGDDEVLEVEYRLKDAHGNWRWMRSLDTLFSRDGRGAARQIVGISEDITAHRQAEEALRRSEDRFRLLAEHALDIIYRYEIWPRRGFAYVSPAITAITGFTPEEHYADPELGLKLMHPEDRPIFRAIQRGGLASGEPFNLRWVRKDGVEIWTEHRNVRVLDEAGNLIAIEGIARDVTERKQAEFALRESEERFHGLAATSFDAIVMLDNDGLVTFWNPAAARMFGYTEQEMLGQDMHDRITSEASRPSFHAAFARFRETGDCRVLNAHIEALGMRRDGSLFPIEISVAPLLLRGRWCATAAIRDITVRKQAETLLLESNQALADANRKLALAFERERLLARTDSLTQVVSRHHFFELALREFAIAKRYALPLSLILFDLDHFKRINDTFGHQVGDEALRQVAGVVREELREADTLARYGGEEFIILLPNSTASEAAKAAERIRERVASHQLNTEQGKFSVTLSFGVAQCETGHETFDHLLGHADKAMYLSKEAGRNRVTIYPGATNQ